MVALRVHGLVVLQQEQRAVGAQNLFGKLCVGVGVQDLSRGSVQPADGRFQPQCDVDGIPHRDQPSGRLCGAVFERPEVVEPRLDGPFPQHDAVERVACRQTPLRGCVDRSTTSHVDDGEQSALRRDHGRHARGNLVVARVLRSPVPLKMPQWANCRIVSHGVVAGIVQVVRPLVDVIRPRLDDLQATLRANLNLPAFDL